MEEMSPNVEPVAIMTADERAAEQKLIRRLQLMMNLVMQTIADRKSVV